MATPPVPELLRAHLKKLAESDERLENKLFILSELKLE